MLGRRFRAPSHRTRYAINGSGVPISAKAASSIVIATDRSIAWIACDVSRSRDENAYEYYDRGGSGPRSVWLAADGSRVTRPVSTPRRGSSTLQQMSAAEGHAHAQLKSAIPALPVRDVRAATAHYRERFGFHARFEVEGFAVLVRDDVVLNLWGASDERWRSRGDLASNPVCSGAESFIAGTASCRIEVGDVDALFEELQRADVLHPTVRDGVTATDFGTREFATLDLDGNLLTFFRREP